MNREKFLRCILIVVTYLVLLKPYYLIEIPLPFLGLKINSIFTILQLILLLFFIVAKLKSSKLNKIDILLVFIILIAMVSNAFNGYSLYFILSNYINLILTYMFFDYEFKSDAKSFLKVSGYLFFFLISINLITILMKPVDYYQMLTRVHFLGYDNDVVTFIFAFILIFILNIYLKNGNKIYSILGIIISIINLILIWSANGVVGLVLLIIYILFLNKIKTNKIFNYNNVLIASIVVFFLIVIFRFQNYFEFFIVDVLGRDLTFTGRTKIWDRALNIWGEHKLLGAGVFDFNYRRSLYGVYHAHCTYLNILFETGLLGLGVRFAFLKSLYDCMKKYKTRICGLVTYFFVIYFVLTLAEVYVNDVLFYILMCLAININLLHEGGKINEN